MKRAAALMTTAARQAKSCRMSIVKTALTELLHCSRNTLICLLMGKFDLNKITETRNNLCLHVKAYPCNEINLVSVYV